MKLYQDYKKEQDLQKKIEEDKKNLGISQETVIIYESSPVSMVLRKFVSILLLMFLLTVLCAVIIALAFYFKEY